VNKDDAVQTRPFFQAICYSHLRQQKHTYRKTHRPSSESRYHFGTVIFYLRMHCISYVLLSLSFAMISNGLKYEDYFTENTLLRYNHLNENTLFRYNHQFRYPHLAHFSYLEAGDTSNCSFLCTPTLACKRDDGTGVYYADSSEILIFRIPCRNVNATMCKEVYTYHEVNEELFWGNRGDTSSSCVWWDLTVFAE
jgi:hypothetical protein